MKVLKPQRLGLLHRTVEHRRRCTLVVSVLVYVPLDAPRKLLTEQSLWKEVAEELPGGIADEGMPKPHGELLLTARAFAPRGEEVRAVMTRASLGSIDKKLAVLGDRHWENGSPSDPQPFRSIPIDWAHAFGGDGFAQNPLGKGIAAVDTEHGPLHFLPNVEDPRHLIASKRDRPPPAGFAAYECMWPQRFAKVGKRYDRRWLETLFPGPAEDFDATYYCVAPPDQQIDGFFVGDEVIALEGMHPDRGRIDARLEPVRVRVFVVRRGAEDQLEAFATRLDTIHLIPHLAKALLVHRATLPVTEDDADDIVHLMVAGEDPAHPKTHEHYQRVLALRLDPEKGALAALKDEDLMPAQGDGWAAKVDPGDMGELMRLEHYGVDAATRGRERKLREVRERLEAAGFEGTVFDEDVTAGFEPPRDPYDFDALMEYSEKMEARRVELEARVAEKKQSVQADAQARLEAAGYDLASLHAAANQAAGGPPTFSADSHLGMLHDMARIAAEGGEPLHDLETELTDPRFEQRLREMEARARDGYRQCAHLLLPAVVEPDRRQLLRTRAQIAIEAREPLSGANLTGADLHGLRFDGMDLSGALLEGADLSGASLRDADLSRAVLARATLCDTILAGACLRGANLGEALLRRALAVGADMSDVVLARATLDGAVLEGATLRGADLFETNFLDADFSHVDGHELMLFRVDLRRVAFAGATLTRSVMIECNLTSVDFTGCDLSEAQLLTCAADGACFIGARLEGTMVLHGSSLKGAQLSGVTATRANLYETALVGAHLEGAILDGANLGKCDMSGAMLRHLRAREALMIRTNLAGADARGADLLGTIAQKAILKGADLTGANLARVDVSRARVDGATRIDGALMLDTRVEPRHEEPSR